MDALGRRRNRIIHDPWFTRNEHEEFGRLEVTADRRLVFEVRAETPNEVMDVARAINDAEAQFNQLRVKFADDLKTSTKERLEAHHGKGSADFLDQLDQDTESE